MLLIVGHTSLDENINRYHESRITRSGAAYMAAIGASIVSKDVGIVTRIGGDYDRASLDRIGINLQGVKQICHGRTTRFKLTYRHEDELQRDFEAAFNVGNDIGPNDVPSKYFERISYVHIATMPPTQQSKFIKFFRETTPGVRISIDTIEAFITGERQQVLDNFDRSDLAWLDRREFDYLSNRAPDCDLVLKAGKEGATFYGRDGIVIHSDAPFVERVVDKTGSGDVLAGAFLAGIAQGDSIEVSLMRGCRIASESIKQFGVDHLLESQISHCEKE